MEKNNYRIFFSKTAVKDKNNLIKAGLYNNCCELLDKMMMDPFFYPPSYEKLVGDLKGFYSRRINRQHRLVYKVDVKKMEIYIYRMWTHYDKF